MYFYAERTYTHIIAATTMAKKYESFASLKAISVLVFVVCQINRS
jgi:hypothetical protein